MKKCNTLKFMTNIYQFSTSNLYSQIHDLHTKIHDEYQFSTSNLHSQIHDLNFHRKKVCLSIFFPWKKSIFPQFSIFISARILVSEMNSRLCILEDLKRFWDFLLGSSQVSVNTPSGLVSRSRSLFFFIAKCAKK